MLKHVPKDVFTKIETTLISSKKPIYYNKTPLVRGVHNGAGKTQTSEKRKNAVDLNIQEIITIFHDMLSGEHVYRGKIIFTRASSVQYEQLLLDSNFRQYLETIMVSKKI